MSIRLRLILVLVAMSTLAMAALSTLFISGNMLMTVERQAAAHQRDTAATQRVLERALTDQAAAVRHYVLSGDEQALIPYRQGVDAELASVAAILGDGRLSDAVHEATRNVVDAADAWRDRYARDAIADVAVGHPEKADNAIALSTDKDLFDRVRVRMDALDEHIAAPTTVWTDQMTLLSTARVLVYITSLIGGVVAMLLTLRALGALVWRPLHRLVDTARQVEAGVDASFRLHRRDEVGDLAASLERMRHRMVEGRRIADAAAEESSVVNFFTELTAFTESDVEVARAMLTAVGELVAPDAAVVHISNRSRDRATPEAFLGPDPGEPLTLRGLEACPGVRRGSLYVTADVARPLAVRCAVHPAAQGTIVCVPLTALGETVGAVHLSWHETDALPLAMRATISRLAEHTALSIGNRRLVLALQGMANTDARTGLPNSRAFDEAVEAAIDRRTAGASDAILMLDLDHFKDFNDRYGHPGGDEALRAFAGILRTSVRDTDIAARYGGEEFAVYLPGVDETGALEIAERIRMRTESAIIALGPGSSARISVSIGLAQSPADGSDRVTLLRAADRALYAAKQSGRNRVATTTGADAGDADRPREGILPRPAPMSRQIGSASFSESA